MECQCHSCPLQTGLWELGQGSQVESQTQTAAVENVKSLARVDRELGVVAQRLISTPPYRPSDGMRGYNFPCCIPVLLSGLSWNSLWECWRVATNCLIAPQTPPSTASPLEVTEVGRMPHPESQDTGLTCNYHMVPAITLGMKSK